VAFIYLGEADLFPLGLITALRTALEMVKAYLIKRPQVTTPYLANDPLGACISVSITGSVKKNIAPFSS